jgi:hypothetical protein
LDHLTATDSHVFYTSIGEKTIKVPKMLNDMMIHLCKYQRNSSLFLTICLLLTPIEDLRGHAFAAKTIVGIILAQDTKTFVSYRRLGIKVTIVFNPLTVVTSLGVKHFHVFKTTINIKDIF